MDSLLKVVLYARFSSDNQRTESIDAQLRAMKKYCAEHQYLIVNQYVDEAKSATTDKRPGFQQMIRDSENGGFQAVIVHKLDRFARNRYDSAVYKQKLKKNNVKVYSVLENLNDSPESVMLEAMLEGMSEYYSKNLGREIMKGMKENAFQGKHTGGKPPLGYKLNAEKKLEIEPKEAKAVQIIFDLVDKGFGYSYIIQYLAEQGYTTKRGNIFRKNSLHELLRNEKYTGVYIYNRLASKDDSGKRNGHRKKAETEWIRIEGGCPAIITKEQFARVQARMKNNRNRGGAYSSKEFYLLTGKIFCGVCGKRMVGNLRFSGRSKSRLATYRCDTHRIVCANKEINKDYLDAYIEEWMAENIYHRSALESMKKQAVQWSKEIEKGKKNQLRKLEMEFYTVQEVVQNLMKALEQGIVSEELYHEIKRRNEEKQAIQIEMDKIKYVSEKKIEEEISVQEILAQYNMLTERNMAYRNFLQKFIRQIIIYPYTVEMVFDFGFGLVEGFEREIVVKKKEIYCKYDSRLRCKKG